MSEVCGSVHPDHPDVTCIKPLASCFQIHNARRGPEQFAWPNERQRPVQETNRPKMNAARDRARERMSKDSGMTGALLLTPEDFKVAFAEAVRDVATKQPTLTSDDVWVLLEERQIDTENRVGVGPLMAGCASRGWLVKSGEHAVSSRPNSKARDGLTVWRSLLHHAPVAQLADATVSRSVPERGVGSSPTGGTSSATISL